MFSQPRDVSNPAADGNHCNVRNGADDFKVHRGTVSFAQPF
jgi:hypothetical protein